MLDDLDRAILAALRADGRMSHRAIAAAVGTTQPTVSARIRRMEDAGIIRGYTVRLDDDAFGGDLSGPAAVACHWCKRRSTEPVWAKAGGRDHPFCCTTCRSAYLEKHARLEQGL